MATGSDTLLKLKTNNSFVKLKQVDILISKNQALQMLCLKHCVYKQHNLNYHVYKKPTKSMKIYLK